MLARQRTRRETVLARITIAAVGSNLNGIETDSNAVPQNIALLVRGKGLTITGDVQSQIKMGWFGKKEKSTAAAAADGAYVDAYDLEHLPVAVAVAESPPPFAPAARGAVAPLPPVQQQQKVVQYEPQGSSIPVVANGVPYNKGTMVTTIPPVLVTASNTSAAPRLQSSSAAAPFQNLIISREPSFLHPCMHCGKNCRTRVVTSPNLLTWIAVVALLFVFWPLCWLPLVFNCTRESRHYCTSCHQNIGTIQPFQDCCTKTRG